MSRYIDADKLKESFNASVTDIHHADFPLDLIWEYIDEQPTVEAREKITGEWIPKEEIKEALEKQIPKEPNYQYDGYSDGLPVFDIWECPSCGQEFEIDYDKHKYCPECGQAIDWEVK